MDSQQYFTLNIHNVKASDEELLTYELFELGAAGVQEDLQFQQVDRQYLPEVVEQDTKTLTVYFEETPQENVITKILKQYPDLDIRMNSHPIKDWLAEWKKQWKPFELVEGVWIVPDWEKESFAVEDKKAIFIEPGMAFGTGTHETTRLASQLLFELTSNQKIESMVDVGTGSGILAILARLFDVNNVYAYDNDEESKRVFFENLEKNNQQSIVWEEQWSSQLQNQSQLCLANIIDGVLLNLKNQFQSLNSQYYLFTGILEEREENFLKEMLEGWELKQLKRMQLGEWVGFLFEAKQ